jgi:hypothetical protein
MVPKRALNVMEGEVNRLLLLSKHAVIPTPYIVPRKVEYSYALHSTETISFTEGAPILSAFTSVVGSITRIL